MAARAASPPVSSRLPGSGRLELAVWRGPSSPWLARARPSLATASSAFAGVAGPRSPERSPWSVSLRSPRSEDLELTNTRYGPLLTAHGASLLPFPLADVTTRIGLWVFQGSACLHKILRDNRFIQGPTFQPPWLERRLGHRSEPRDCSGPSFGRRGGGRRRRRRERGFMRKAPAWASSSAAAPEANERNTAREELEVGCKTTG
ncbi:hypothetical protein NL676_009224 [Syzygium grande]|nr:hypothetical protein NL676_009224 [Syzygium grande]